MLKMTMALMLSTALMTSSVPTPFEEAKGLVIDNDIQTEDLKLLKEPNAYKNPRLEMVTKEFDRLRIEKEKQLEEERVRLEQERIKQEQERLKKEQERIKQEQERLKKEQEEKLRREEQEKQSYQQKLKEQGQTFVLTYYGSTVNECGNDLGITASGKKVQSGMVAAPPCLSFGTQVQIGDTIYTVEDRGHPDFIKQNDDGSIRLDVFVPRLDGESTTHYENRVNNMGVKRVNGVIIRNGRG